MAADNVICETPQQADRAAALMGATRLGIELAEDGVTVREASCRHYLDADFREICRWRPDAGGSLLMVGKSMVGELRDGYIRTEELQDGYWLHVARRLFEVADALQPAFDRAEAAFQQVLDCTSDGMAHYDGWIKAITEYNAAADPFVTEIASLTRNGESTLRSVYGPRAIGALVPQAKYATEPRRFDPTMTWWSPESLRNIGRYRSFNAKLWSQHSGMQRPPYWTDEEIRPAAQRQRMLPA